MDANHTPKPRMPGIAHLAVFGPVGVPSSRCTTRCDRTAPSGCAHLETSSRRTNSPPVRSDGGNSTWRVSKLAAGGLLALLFRLLNWRAWHRAVGAEDTAVSSLGSQQLSAPLAVIEKLARVGRHRLGLLVPAVWASDGRLQLDHADRLFQSAKVSRPRNKTSAGKRTESSRPMTADRPTAQGARQARA
jgi:hypothetical protein